MDDGTSRTVHGVQVCTALHTLETTQEFGLACAGRVQQGSKMTSKIFGYARTSTDRQNLDLQLDALKAAGCDEIISEIASGAKKDRPELQALMAKLREGDKLVVWKLDRLARSMRQLIETVENLAAQGIEFQSITESIDTSSPGGKLVFGIFASLAEFERELIRERVNAGLQAARNKGKIGGRPKALSDDQIKIARVMKPSHSLTEIASHLGVAKSTVHRVFQTGV